MNTIKTAFTTNASMMPVCTSTHTLSLCLRRLSMLAILIVTFVSGMRAASYTISSGNNYLGINNGAIANINPFNASTCVWTGPDSGSGRFSMTVNGTTYYLRYNNGLTVTTNQNNATSWTINGERLSTGTRYIRYNNGWTTVNNPNNWTTGLDILAKLSFDPTGITAEGVEIVVGEEGKITYNLTSTSGTPVYDNVTFSINNTGIATINATTGVVTGVSAGTATVTVTAKKQDGTTACTATCSVVVKEPTPIQYVFYYSSNYGDAYYLAVNEDRDGVTRTNTFDAETCIWTGVDVGAGVYSATVDGTIYYLRLQSSGYYNYTLTITTDKDQATEWTRNGAKLSGNGRYVRYSNSSWTTTTTSTNSGTDVLYPITKSSDGDPTDEVAYAVGATNVSPASATLDFAKTAQFTSDAEVTKTTTTTKTVTYQHSSSGGTTIRPSSTVKEVLTETLAPTGYDWKLSSTENLTIGSGTANANTVTYSTASGTTKNVTLSVTAYYMNGTTKVAGTTGTASIIVNEKLEDPTGITADPMTLAVDEQKSISYSLQPSNANDDIAYSGYDNTVIAVDANGVVRGLKAGKTTVTLTAKRLDGSNGPTATCAVTVTPKAPTIEFSLGTGITVTITTEETNGTIYYTTNGDVPTTNSTPYTAPFIVESGVTVKAMVVVMADGEQLVSPVAESLANAGSGIIGSTVYLYDLEDHNWTYYSGVEASVDGGNYNTKYAGKLYSPNPRNVKITYNGVNGISGSSTNVRVSISESENSFVYYKTLEQGSTQGEYPYTVISNPFSVRPSTGSGSSKVYYGFAGWKVKAGGEYIKTYNNGDVLPLDAEIVFENLPYPSKNCTSAEIVFETTWTQANVQTGNNIATMLGKFSGGTYETNFAVLTGQYTTAWTGNKNATITSVYPDGSSDSRSSSVYTRLNLTLNSGYTIKYEYIYVNNSSSTFSMGTGAKTLYLGRGIANSTAGGVCCNLIQGYDGSISSGGLTYTLKIESGIYNYLSFIKGYDGANTGNTVTGTVAVKGVLGCDYDRAANNNSNLKIQQHAIMGYASNNAVLLKSPAAGAEVLNVTFKSGSLNSNRTSAGTADVAESFYIGIGGGYSPGYRIFTMEGGEMWSLAAGICQNTAETNSIRFRIKGGLIKGSIYGSAANANSYGYKQMILTGGHVKGWIAGGGNGTSSNGGVTTGSTYIYVGGNCRVDSEGSNTKINSSLGGQVFGSGSGVENTTTWGQLLYGSNVVVADNAYIERSVFGGGNFGWTEDDATVYITGEKSSIGNVYGGANQNKGENVKIFMTGGTIREGLYGGSNISGKISGDVALQINGGQVGTSSSPANIHGGGYGNQTTVDGNITLALGSNTTDPGVTVYGDVYGGSALGDVNNAVSDYTKVTLNCGGINGSLYGGGLGDASNEAAVNGAVTVNVNGGRVTGAVYGCNNVKGAPASTVTVNIYNTAAPLESREYALNAVYGGGNKAPYTYSAGPVVNVYDGYVANVFGGGNEASVAKTDVNILGGRLLGNVYGGGNKADVTGNTDVDVTGGRIYNVFGGNNESGTIAGEVHVDISHVPAVTAYGSTDVDYVYGGGNLAPYTVGTASKNFPMVNMISGQVRYALYGGGLGASAIVTGNPQVRMTGGVVGYSETVDEAVIVRGGDVFGGGNAAAVKGNTSVVITGGEIKHNVYGGGNQADVSGTTNVKIGN